MVTEKLMAESLRHVAFAACCTALWATCFATAKADSSLQEAANPSTETSGTEFAPTNTVKVTQIRYIPPFRGAPSRRIGGATRNVKSEVHYLAVIAPIESGLTTQSMPNLYWYLMEATEASVEITIMHPNEIEPRLEIRLPGPISSGRHPLSLREHRIELETGVEYIWHVAVVSDASARSADIVSSGTITRAQPSPELGGLLAGKQGLERAKVLAAEGIWYDAVDVLASELDQNKTEPALRRGLAALLSQVGLHRVAAD